MARPVGVRQIAIGVKSETAEILKPSAAFCRVTIHLMFFRLLIIISLIGAWLTAAAPAAAQDNDVFQILARINALRQQNGLLPLDLNGVLATSAQRHSDDMARPGSVSHTGSDGSSIDSRIRDAGYGHWRDFGIWSENIYGGQTANVAVAWEFWTTSQVHRNNLLNPRYREIGIGVGRSANGGAYYTLNFGAQPNTLPFFVTGSAPVVTLLLSNENDITTGEGVAVMGQATEVRAAEGTDTSNASWQPWVQSLPFQLSDGSDQKTITVEYRDELGRGTKATRTFNVTDLAPAQATPEPSPTPTELPTATPTDAVTPTPLATISATVPVSLTVSPTLTPTPAPTETPTATPLPIETLSPTTAPTAEPTTAAPPTATPRPSASPTPIASPTSTATLVPRVIAANLATSPAVSRVTPPAPRPAAPERPLFDFAASPGLNTFAIAIGLQVVVLAIAGGVVVVRWRRRS